MPMINGVDPSFLAVMGMPLPAYLSAATQWIVPCTFRPSGASPPRVAGSYVHRSSLTFPDASFTIYRGEKVGIVGAGYVGLPLAQVFAEAGRVLRPGGWAAFPISNLPAIHRPAGVAGRTCRSETAGR